MYLELIIFNFSYYNNVTLYARKVMSEKALGKEEEGCLRFLSTKGLVHDFQLKTDAQG